MGTLASALAAVAAFGFTLWAGLVALGSAADVEEGATPAGVADLPPARRLHVGHRALLLLAGASASTALGWWAFPVAAGSVRLLAGVLFVWVLGDLVPRLLAAIAPELAPSARIGAERSLAPFGPFWRLVARLDRAVRPAAPPRRAVDAGEDADMAVGVFALGRTTVAEVMTPRIDIVAVDLLATREAVVETLRNSEHARLLVYDGHPDAVAGVVFAKDMLPGLMDGGAADIAWQSLIRPAAFVPEGKTLDRQLRDFKRGPSHIAVVVDEFGGTAGLVTLEDILEEIVGEIRDEHDTDEVAPIQPLGDDRYRVQGGVSLADLEETLGHRFGRDDVATVGGLVLAALGRVPRAGEQLVLEGVEFTVELVARRRVRRVQVHRLQPLPASEPAEPGEP